MLLYDFEVILIGLLLETFFVFRNLVDEVDVIFLVWIFGTDVSFACTLFYFIFTISYVFTCWFYFSMYLHLEISQ